MNEEFEPLYEEVVIENQEILDEAIQEQGNKLLLMITLFISNILSLISDLRMIQRRFHKPWWENFVLWYDAIKEKNEIHDKESSLGNCWIT